MTPPFELISAYLDDELDAAGVHELRAWMKKDPSHVKLFIRESYVHQRMREAFRSESQQRLLKEDSGLQEFDDRAAVEDDNNRATILAEVLEQERVARLKREAAAALEKQQQETVDAERRESMRRLAGLNRPNSGPQTRHYVIPKPLFYGSIAAVIAVAAAVMWPQYRKTEPTPADRSPDPAIEMASVVDLIDARWEGTSSEITSGSPLYDEPVRLVSGVAKVRFKNGAEVILEAPCAFEPVTMGEVYLSEGKLLGRCETPGSKGFVVRTAHARVVDLGTEFGVSVGDGLAEVHVFEGKVALAPVVTKALQPARELTAGNALRVESSGQTPVVPVDDLRFVRDDEFVARVNARQGGARERWLAYKFNLRRNSSLVAWYDVGRNNTDGRLLNAASASHPVDGLISGNASGRACRGRFGDDKALSFNGIDEFVFINDRPDLRLTDEFTLSVWMRYNAAPSPNAFSRLIGKDFNGKDVPSSNYSLWLTNGGVVSEGRTDTFAQWQVPGRDAQGEFINNYINGQTSLRLGQWYQITAVVRGGMMKLYVNGVEDAVPVGIRGDRLVNDQPVSIGYCPMNSAWEAEHFAGEMSDVLIFRRGLSDEEVLQLYEKSKPGD